MTEYTVSKGRILHKGVMYVEGDVIELDDSFAERLTPYISSVDNTDDTEQSKADEQATVDYNDLTIAELKELVEEQNIDVDPTGKNGSAVKSDYVRALEETN